MNGRLYIHKNKINGKCYVGQTIKQKTSYRWGKNGYSYHNQNKFYNAIQKYGWDNFEHIILPTIYYTQDELNQAEIDMIQELDTINNGYNVSLGGNIYSMSDEALLKVSKVVSKYDNDGFIVKTYPSLIEAARQHNGFASNILSATKLDVSKSAYGFYWSMGNKPKINVSNLYVERNKNIAQIENNNIVRVFSSITEAANYINGNRGNIKRAYKNNSNAYGYKWRYIWLIQA